MEGAPGLSRKEIPVEKKSPSRIAFLHLQQPAYGSTLSPYDRSPCGDTDQESAGSLPRGRGTPCRGAGDLFRHRGQLLQGHQPAEYRARFFHAEHCGHRPDGRHHRRRAGPVCGGGHLHGECLCRHLHGRQQCSLPAGHALSRLPSGPLVGLFNGVLVTSATCRPSSPPWAPPSCCGARG